MKIIQITAVKGVVTSLVFGLGSDNKIYCWDTKTGTWILEA